MIRRHIVFLHVPKTGGTSVRNALARALPDHRQIYDYGAAAPETSAEIRTHLYGSTPPRLPGNFLARIDDGRPMLVAGHFRGARYWPHFNADSFVTILRDPLERIFSEYNHLVRHRGLDQTLEQFATEARPRIISKLLEKTEPLNYGFIGFTDTLAEDAARLSEFVGCEIAVERENLGDYLPEIAARAADPEFRGWVARQIGDDLELYRHIRERFWRRRARLYRASRAPGAIRGRVRPVCGTAVVGFAVGKEREEVVALDLVIDGRVVAGIAADRFCLPLRRRRIARSGVAGFHHSLLPYIAATSGAVEVGVRVTATGEHLPGSPFTLPARPPVSGAARVDGVT